MVRLLVVLILSGCTPFVEYEHLDPTPLSMDGMAYDFLCLGTEHNKDKISIGIAGCKNMHSVGGQYLKGNIKVRLR